MDNGGQPFAMDDPKVKFKAELLNMSTAIEKAAQFIMSRLNREQDVVKEAELNQFYQNLIEVLTEKYTGHWDVVNSSKGSGYRCIHVDGIKPDPVLLRAAELSDISPQALCQLLPKIDLRLCVDPGYIVYRHKFFNYDRLYTAYSKLKSIY